MISLTSGAGWGIPAGDGAIAQDNNDRTMVRMRSPSTRRTTDLRQPYWTWAMAWLSLCARTWSNNLSGLQRSLWDAAAVGGENGFELFITINKIVVGYDRPGLFPAPIPATAPVIVPPAFGLDIGLTFEATLNSWDFNQQQMAFHIDYAPAAYLRHISWVLQRDPSPGATKLMLQPHRYLTAPISTLGGPALVGFQPFIPDSANHVNHNPLHSYIGLLTTGSLVRFTVDAYSDDYTLFSWPLRYTKTYEIP